MNDNLKPQETSPDAADIKTKTPYHPTLRALRKLIPMLFVANACLTEGHWIYFWIVLAYVALWLNAQRDKR